MDHKVKDIDISIRISMSPKQWVEKTVRLP